MKFKIAIFMTLLFVFPIDQSESSSKKPPSWIHLLSKKIRKLEKDFKGEFGVYVLDLDSNHFFSYRGDQPWYLSSTVKVPVAIALLRMVDQKKVDLNEKVTIRKSDYRDGSGVINWIKPGDKTTYKFLLDQMIIYSDNAATDLIIKKIGLDQVNQVIKEFAIQSEFGPITTLIDVRRKAYSEIHPKAGQFSNMDYIDIKQEKEPVRKIAHIAKLLKIKEKDLIVADLDDGFERYYAKGWNTATLTSYAELLKNLVQQKILSPESTQMLIKIMSGIQTGKMRLRKGLSREIVFAHKTGTQHRQACDLGVARERKNKTAKALILVCTRKWKTLGEAESLMAKIGKIISQTNLL